MKNLLKNLVIAGSVLVGAKGFSQNTNENIEKYLSDSDNWKTYEVNQGMKQPEYCDSNLVNFLDAAKWKSYSVNEGIKQPEYCAKDSTKKQELPSFKETKEKLGIKYITEVDNLGYGYVTSKPEYGTSNEHQNYRNLKLIQNIKDGNIKVKNNGKRILYSGKILGEPSKEILENVDCIEKDYIITPEEISQALKREYEKAFKEYAFEELDVPKDSVIEVGKGYVTSKNLESLLTATGKIYKIMAGEPIENIYEIMSNEDAVLTEKEILSAAKAVNSSLRRFE